MPSYDFDVIFSLEARSNVLLEVITERYGLSDSRVFAEIQDAASHLRRLLAEKGIKYLDLKRALVPNIDRVERAFVFDWTKFDSDWYGRQVHELVLPLLERGSSRSVLVGDWTSEHRFAEICSESFADRVDARMLDPTRRADTLYFVYLNNLTSASAARIDSALSGHVAYLGALELTYSSLMKVFLSGMLMRIYIQHRSTIIQGHEDDRDDMEDVNLIGYEFAKFGYTNRSVPLWLHGWFLSYKIERPVLSVEDSDTRFSLNAMTPTPYPIAQCVVELDERKLDYLQREKFGSLRRAELHTLSAEEVSAQLRSKLASNYIYSLARATNGDALKFNIMLENPGMCRYLCALEYLPQEQKLRLITLF
jgi:hypothetical protein